MSRRSDFPTRDGRGESDVEHPIPVVALRDDDSELICSGAPSGEYPPLDSGGIRSVHDHVFSRIEETPTQTDPFPHVYVREVFPRDFYAQLIAQLPDDDRYQPFPVPYESRLSIDLKPDAAAQLGPFWRTFESWINGQDFLSGMVEKFAQFLPLMHPHRASLVDANTNDGQVSIRAHTILNRDYANFALGPHTGGLRKFIVALFYLPGDNRFSGFGTSIYRPRETGFVAWESPVYPHDKFELVRTFPNLPNSLFIFVKTDNSFHGVEPGPDRNDGRNLLMWIPKISASRRTGRPLTVPVEALTG